MSRSVSAVSMARSEYCRCPPRLPTPTASQVAIASGANHTVISPRWTSARSYAGQFPTWYCVLYFGCTLDFISRSCACCRHDGQEVDRGAPRARDPCTNATATAVECSRSDDQDGEGHRTTAVEEGVWLPSAGSRGERLLQVQIDHRHWPSSAHARRAKGRGAARMQHPKSDDGPWRARVVRYR